MFLSQSSRRNESFSQLELAYQNMIFISLKIYGALNCSYFYKFKLDGILQDDGSKFANEVGAVSI